MRKNNKTGVAGVSIKKGEYRVQLNRVGKNYDLGIFDTIEEAAEVRREAEARYAAGLPPKKPSDKKPKNKGIHVAMDKDTLADLEWCAKKLGTDKSKVLRMGIAKIKNDIEK